MGEAASDKNLNFSLLRLPGADASPRTERLNSLDLGLPAIAAALDPDRQHARFCASVLAELAPDPATISYRQTVLQDFLDFPALEEKTFEALPQLRELADLGRNRFWSGETLPLHQVGGRLAELDIYVGCVERLATVLAQNPVKSDGLKNFRALLDETRQSAEYRTLADELPILRGQLERAASITIGINLDAQMRPEGATLLAINPERFGGKSGLMERLFGGNAPGERGVLPLYKAKDPANNAGQPPEHELFREMNKLIEKIAAPVAEALARYTRMNSAALGKLEAELAFYTGAARLIRRLQKAGFALCRPEIAPADERVCRITGVYNLELALKLDSPAKVVANDLNFSPSARTFILTGPNSGGKTTYTRAIGQVQALFQAGLYVPGAQARISPVDHIYSHFAAAEQDTGRARGGRLAEELERIGAIFRTATAHSLLLFNEPLASTDHASARVLSRDILNGLRLLGARTVYVTHIHELADDADAASGLISLVAGLDEGDEQSLTPTYTIKPGRPHLLSYAAELARQHGLSLSQITRTLTERGMGDGESR
jgi:DNA mismatch repair protein MutS